MLTGKTSCWGKNKANRWVTQLTNANHWVAHLFSKANYWVANLMKKVNHWVVHLMSKY